MKTLSGIMSQKSKIEYMESCLARYPGRNRAGKSTMFDQVSDTLGWERKHAIKALNGRVSLGQGARKRGSKATYSEGEKRVIVEIWKRSEQPCGKLLKPTIPLWLESYETHHGSLSEETRRKVLQCSARQLDRITAPHKLSDAGRHGRSTGRTSHRLKSTVAVRCGPWEVDRPGWLEVDTVSHGGGSSSGEFMWSLTLTDIHTGWTELAVTHVVHENDDHLGLGLGGEDRNCQAGQQNEGEGFHGWCEQASEKDAGAAFHAFGAVFHGGTPILLSDAALRAHHPSRRAASSWLVRYQTSRPACVYP
jgi:hypothetical protein